MPRNTSEYRYREDVDHGAQARRDEALELLQKVQHEEAASLHAIHHIGDSEETGRLEPDERNRFWELLPDREDVRGMKLNEQETRELAGLFRKGLDAALDDMRDAEPENQPLVEDTRTLLEREALEAVIGSSWCIRDLHAEHAGPGHHAVDAYGWTARRRLYDGESTLENIADRLVSTSRELERFLAGNPPEWFRPDVMVMEGELEQMGYNPIHNRPVDANDPAALREFVERRLEYHVDERGVSPRTFAMTMMGPYRDEPGWEARDWEPKDSVQGIEPLDNFPNRRIIGLDHTQILREGVTSRAVFGGELMAGARAGDAETSARGMRESIRMLENLRAAEQLLQPGRERQDPRGYDRSMDWREAGHGQNYRAVLELTDGLKDNTLLRDFIREQLEHIQSLPDEDAQGLLSHDAQHHLQEALRETDETERLEWPMDWWQEDRDVMDDAMRELRQYGRDLEPFWKDPQAGILYRRVAIRLAHADAMMDVLHQQQQQD